MGIFSLDEFKWVNLNIHTSVAYMLAIHLILTSLTFPSGTGTLCSSLKEREFWWVGRKKHERVSRVSCLLLVWTQNLISESRFCLLYLSYKLFHRWTVTTMFSGGAAPFFFGGGVRNWSLLEINEYKITDGYFPWAPPFWYR